MQLNAYLIAISKVQQFEKKKKNNRIVQSVHKLMSQLSVLIKTTVRVIEYRFKITK